MFSIPTIAVNTNKNKKRLTNTRSMRKFNTKIVILKKKTSKDTKLKIK